MAEEDLRTLHVSTFTRELNDLRVVDQLSMVTSGRIRPLKHKYSKDVNIQNSRFISHRITSSLLALV